MSEKVPVIDRSLTFLFTDIEDSTGHWQRMPDSTRTAVEQHDAILHSAILQENGRVFRTAGDAFYASFLNASSAIRAALTAQRALQSHFRANSPLLLRVRMALHTGPVQERDGDYYGLAPAGAARLLEITRGGQILLTGITAAEVGGNLPEQASLIDVGERHLRSFTETFQLFQVGHPELPAVFPPPQTLQIPNNLPRALTPFIGRLRELGEIRHFVVTSPLVTLVGAGGCGKTRTATQVCDYLFSAFADGIWFLDLAHLTDGKAIPQVIADVIQLRPQPNIDLIEQISSVLQNKRVLLLWDNCEHLVEDAATIASHLLAHLPGLHILATSREALNVPGEVRFPVSPLALPERDTITEPVRLLQYDSVRLFVDRLTSVTPSFQLNEGNASAIVSICQRLDGIPLALIIVAAWGSALPPQQIEQRIQDRFRLLKASGPRPSLPHHQTLRAAIDWSYTLLSEAERALLQRVGVFAGGWTLEAAEAVCDMPPVDDVMETLMSLTHKSLILFEETSDGGRYRLLDTIRQYALEHLDNSTEVESLRNRHRDYYLQWVKQVSPQFYGADAAQWMAQTDTENGNLRAALELTEDKLSGLHFVGSLFWYWHVRAIPIEGSKWIQRFIDTPGEIPVQEHAILARVHNGAGILAWDISDSEGASDHFYQSLKLHRELGNHEAAAGCLSNLGSIAIQNSDMESGRRYLEESLTLFQTTNNLARQAIVLGNLGALEARCERFEEAIPYYEQSLQIQRQLERNSALAIVLHNLARSYQKLNCIRDAYRLLRESHQIYQMFDHRPGIANLIDTTITLLVQDERFEEAPELLAASKLYRDTYQISRSDDDDLKEAIAELDRYHNGTLYRTEEKSGQITDIKDILENVLRQGDSDEQ